MRAGAVVGVVLFAARGLVSGERVRIERRRSLDGFARQQLRCWRFHRTLLRRCAAKTNEHGRTDDNRDDDPSDHASSLTRGCSDSSCANIRAFVSVRVHTTFRATVAAADVHAASGSETARARGVMFLAA